MTNEQELSKKLAEWAGWQDIILAVANYIGYDPQKSQAKVRYKDLIPNFTESLDACDKWLVPLSLEILTKQGYCPPIMKLFQLWYDELVSLTGDSSNVQQAALALCLAISKLIDGGSYEAEG